MLQRDDHSLVCAQFNAVADSMVGAVGMRREE
jgi:hypothetical protein